MSKKIPDFPEFAVLDFGHKKNIDNMVNEFLPYSDFNFISLFCWNTTGKTKISKLKSNFVIQLADYIEGDITWSIIGNTDIDKSLLELLSAVNELKLVPHVVINNIAEKGKFTILQDRDSFDYLYDVRSLATLPGLAYKKKRNKANRFKTSVENLTVLNTKRITISDANKLKNVFMSWIEQNNKIPEEFEAENSAILRFLNYADHFNIISTQIYANDELVAFSFNEILDNGYAICHFEKALTVHEDIYPFLAQESAKVLLNEGCEILNWEQDLGIDGLRQAKLAYKPTRMLKKYTVTIA
jgi:hypothetical protein